MIPQSVTTNKLPLLGQTFFQRLLKTSPVAGAGGGGQMTADDSSHLTCGQTTVSDGFHGKAKEGNCKNRGRKVKFNLFGSAHTAP